jgi:excisionase family DNA binding protein
MTQAAQTRHKKFLRQQGLAEMLGVTTRTIHRWMTEKRIPFYKMSRATLFDVDEVLAAIKPFKREVAV